MEVKSTIIASTTVGKMADGQAYQTLKRSHVGHDKISNRSAHIDVCRLDWTLISCSVVVLYTELTSTVAQLWRNQVI